MLLRLFQDDFQGIQDRGFCSGYCRLIELFQALGTPPWVDFLGYFPKWPLRKPSAGGRLRNMSPCLADLVDHLLDLAPATRYRDVDILAHDFMAPSRSVLQPAVQALHAVVQSFPARVPLGRLRDLSESQQVLRTATMRDMCMLAAIDGAQVALGLALGLVDRWLHAVDQKAVDMALVKRVGRAALTLAARYLCLRLRGVPVSVYSEETLLTTKCLPSLPALMFQTPPYLLLASSSGPSSKCAVSNVDPLGGPEFFFSGTRSRWGERWPSVHDGSRACAVHVNTVYAEYASTTYPLPGVLDQVAHLKSLLRGDPP